MKSPLAFFRDVTHLLAPLMANCRDFHEQWTAAAGAIAPAGRWQGEWRSVASGHHGPLKCVIDTHHDGIWHATFHAGYARIFRACYATRLSVSQEGGRWRFSGRFDLGRLAGGVYEYEGEATADTFVSSYRNRYDHGEFRLTKSGDR